MPNDHNSLEGFWKLDADILVHLSHHKGLRMKTLRDYGTLHFTNQTIPSWATPQKELIFNRVARNPSKGLGSYLRYKGQKFDLDKAFIEVLIDDLLFERYLKRKKSFLAHVPFDYTVLPPKIRVALFNLYLQLKKDPKFPEWPSDLTVDLLRHAFLGSVKQQMKKDLPYIWFWPQHYSHALCLTHDCDSASSFKNIESIREIERGYGYVSSWNFVPRKYALDYRKIKSLQEEGCEIGIHDYDHTGKIAFDDTNLAKRKIAYGLKKFRDFDVRGFRSGLLQRNEKFLRILSEYFLYDSSVSDADINSPLSYRNGVCTVFPYFVNKMIELPITMPQDWRLIRMGFKEHEMLELWNSKAHLIRNVHGIINFNLHPDDFISGNEKYLRTYDKLLRDLSKMDEVWAALPKDIAIWWSERANSKIVGGKIKGSRRATIRYY